MSVNNFRKNSKFQNDSKIFSLSGNLEPLKESLLKRGWTECKNIESPCQFVWTQKKYFNVESSNGISPTLVNRIQRRKLFDFTMKEGLKNCAEDYQNSVETPRTHIIEDAESKEIFLVDVTLTKSISFLKFLNSIDLRSALSASSSLCLIEFVNYAKNVIKLMENIKNHEDIDEDLSLNLPKHYLRMIPAILKNKKKFKLMENFEQDTLKSEIEKTLKSVEEIWPERRYDALESLWIIKPANGSCGKGIMLKNSEEEVLKIVKSKFNRKFIIQKYIGELVDGQQKFHNLILELYKYFYRATFPNSQYQI